MELEKLCEIFHKFDPIGLSYKNDLRKDEYRTEAIACLSRLHRPLTVYSIAGLLYDEFCFWFDVNIVDRCLRDDESLFVKIAKEIKKELEDARN
jgi:hypothetical protein